MQQQDVERIARVALRELGVDAADRASVAAGDPAGSWRIAFDGPHGPIELHVKGGAGTTAQWVREQIVQQYLAQT